MTDIQSNGLSDLIQALHDSGVWERPLAQHVALNQLTAPICLGVLLGIATLSRLTWKRVRGQDIELIVLLAILVGLMALFATVEGIMSLMALAAPELTLVQSLLP